MVTLSSFKKILHSMGSVEQNVYNYPGVGIHGVALVNRLWLGGASIKRCKPSTGLESMLIHSHASQPDLLHINALYVCMYVQYILYACDISCSCSP